MNKIPVRIVPGQPFDWLDDAQFRLGGLWMIETAIARGWLEGAKQRLGPGTRAGVRS